jgi:hypothetical protein
MHNMPRRSRKERRKMQPTRFSTGSAKRNHSNSGLIRCEKSVVPVVIDIAIFGSSDHTVLCFRETFENLVQISENVKLFSCGMARRIGLGIR